MLNRYDYNDDDLMRRDDGDDPGEKLSNAIERITRDAKKLSDTLGEQIEYLATRHRLVAEMLTLEIGADIPLKTLEKRVALLTEIRSHAPEFTRMKEKDLKERIALIETIKALEPEGQQTPIKKLRERARLLERIDDADMGETETENEDA